MKNRALIAVAGISLLLWVSVEVFAQRGGRGGGGGRAGGGARPAARPSAPVARPSAPARPSTPINRTPSFSRPSTLPSHPGVSRPGVDRPAQRPDIDVGSRPGINRPSTLPSNRPDLGGRPGVGSRPSVGTLPAIGAGIGTGAGSGNRLDRPTTLPGLGDRRPVDRTPQERRQDLQDRLGGARPDQLPARDWNQVRSDWQGRRDQIREDWQSHRDEARDDWQNWFDDHYPQYGGWYWGHAPGYWGRWDYLWDNYPVAAAVGLTWWGVNAMSYRFGYGDYSNPYYEEGTPVSYTDPIVTAPVEAPKEDTGLPPGVSKDAIEKFDLARAAFMERSYEKALKLTDEAVALMPRDAVLHEFRSLVLFALKRYSESAAAIHAVLAVGPGWDAKTLTGLYPDMDTYTAQLRAMEEYRNNNPKAADVRFLCGYHYMTLGHPDAALEAFRRVTELQPKDTVSAALVASLSPRDAAPSKPPAEAPKAVPAEEVVGVWTATGRGSAKYNMILDKDGTFIWSFTRGSRKDEVKGVYTLAGNVLGMEPDGGGDMLAQVTRKGDTLIFEMVGDKSPPLEFHRGSSK